MSNRKCSDLLAAYLEYTEQLESPTNYHIWSFLGTVAACLRRKVWLDLGFFSLYPNLYIVLVGPPGCKKSTAINAAMGLVDGAEEGSPMADVKVSADAITREALIQTLRKSRKEDTLIDGKPYIHSSLSIVSKELSVFIGTGNHDLLSLLTDLYDCPRHWEYRTKNQGVDTINGVWLNMLAASTPTWLVGSIPMTAIGGGFTSRVIFVVEDRERQRTAFPRFTPKEFELQANLKHDLEQISLIAGPITLTPEASEAYEHWYTTRQDIIDNPRFHGYYERKHMHILKVAMLISICENDETVIELRHFERAINYIEALEKRMVEAFGAAGRADIAADINDLLDIINKAGTHGVEKKELQRACLMDVDPDTFDRVIHQLHQLEYIKIDIEEGLTIFRINPAFFGGDAC